MLTLHHSCFSSNNQLTPSVIQQRLRTAYSSLEKPQHKLLAAEQKYNYGKKVIDLYELNKPSCSSAKSYFAAFIALEKFKNNIKQAQLKILRYQMPTNEKELKGFENMINGYAICIKKMYSTTDVITSDLVERMLARPLQNGLVEKNATNPQVTPQAPLTAKPSNSEL